MSSLTIRNLPDDLHERLRALAERNRRSLNNEIIHRLEASVSASAPDPDAALERVRAVREDAPLPYLREERLRAAREKGRA